MTEERAEELGRQAFHAGNVCAPLADPEMFAEHEDPQVGEKTHLMRALSRGWTAENFAADPSTTHG